MLGATANSQATLANALGMSPKYVSAIMGGGRKASARWLDLVADTLGLSADERLKLHRAGAIDKGYKIDLTK